jgi:hypothetical protein
MKEGCILCLQICFNSMNEIIITFEVVTTVLETRKSQQRQIWGVWGIRQQLESTIGCLGLFNLCFVNSCIVLCFMNWCIVLQEMDSSS